MEGTSVDDQHRDSASLVPDGHNHGGRSSGFNNDHLASGRPSIVRRMSAPTRFSIAVTHWCWGHAAWQSYGDEAREALSAGLLSLSGHCSATTSAPNGQGSAQNTGVPQSMPVPQQ